MKTEPLTDEDRAILLALAQSPANRVWKKVIELHREGVMNQLLTTTEMGDVCRLQGQLIAMSTIAGLPDLYLQMEKQRDQMKRASSQ